MTKKLKILFLPLIYLFISSCSFDSTEGFWKGDEEKRRVYEIAKAQKEAEKERNTLKIYSSENIYEKEIKAVKQVSLSKPIKNLTWEMSGMNYQNFLGNIYLPSIENRFLKKKIGKNKFSFTQAISSPIIFNKNIVFADDTGTIYNIFKNGKVSWKKNIYKKIYKKIYKTVTFAIYKDAIYAADNIGFIYKIDAKSGKLVWIKNHGIPLKSNIKVFDEKIFLINQDNRVLCLGVNDGSLIWNFRTVLSFIKSPDLLSLAISENKDLVVLNSSGELIKAKSTNGRIYWTADISRSAYAHDTDFLKSSDVVLTNNEIIFSSSNSTYSFNSKTALLNWELNLSSTSTPIIDGNNVFMITDNGFFINIDKNSGKFIWSTNILKVLKRKKQSTSISGFVLGSGKIYAVTKNGFLIICSASSGKVEAYKKIGDNILANPIISDGALYVLTEDSRIFGFN